MIKNKINQLVLNMPRSGGHVFQLDILFPDDLDNFFGFLKHFGVVLVVALNDALHSQGLFVFSPVSPFENCFVGSQDK